MQTIAIREQNREAADEELLEGQRAWRYDLYGLMEFLKRAEASNNSVQAALASSLRTNGLVEKLPSHDNDLRAFNTVFLPMLEPAPDVLGGAALMIPVLSPTRHEWYERGVGARRALVVSTVLECAEIRLLDLELFGLLAYARDQFWIAEEVCACARAHVFSHTKPCMTSHIHTHMHATS